MKRFGLVISLCFLALAACSQVSISHLRCEWLQSPLGIDAAMPRLSWQLQSEQRNIKQQAYQLLVASSAAMLESDKADIWNSGKVSSDISIHIPFGGGVLSSGKKYFWKVKSFTNKGETPWSDIQHWSMGLLKPADWKAQWIGYDKASPWDSISQWSKLSARYLRKEFAAKSNIASATVYVSGLGLFELFINGKRIGDQVLAPNPTDYRKSVLYNTYDVTDAIAGGNNAIGTILGNGRYFTMRQDYKTHKINNFGFPKLLLQLHIHYTDGTSQVVVSDGTWKLNADGAIRSNNEYDGEIYDARKEFKDWSKTGFNDKGWMRAQLVDSPDGKLTAQPNPSMKVMQVLKPVAIFPIDKGKYIIDMGQNFSGWLRMRNVAGSKGSKIVIRFAESLQQDGQLYTANLRDARATDEYVFGEQSIGNEGWAPTFVYHGFRYAELSGFPGVPQLSQFAGEVVYDDLETTGSFESSNSVLNTIYRNAWWGVASNYKGMPVDCPQRNERQPWLGDRTVGAQGESFMFNNAALYAKWMQDIEESQTAESSIPDVAPAFWNYYSDDVTWPAAYFFVTNHLYNQFGDVQPIKKHYASMKKWMMYMKGKYMKNHILTRDKYGDWCVPPENLELIHAKDTTRLTDGQLIATAYYYKLLDYMQRFAKLNDKPADAAYFKLLGDSVRTAFQQKFFDTKQKYYGNNTVTANILPLYFGICPDELRPVVFEKIRRRIHVDDHDHISTGLIGSQWLMRGLTDFGYAELAYILASNKTYPSWGYMAENGATTIWELWNGNTADPKMNSQNHVMLLGDLITWYYENLGGIRTHKTHVGFKQVIMKPVMPAGLEWVNASYNSPYGVIRSEWKNGIDEYEWHISIPANSSALVYFPATAASELWEQGKALSEAEGCKIIKEEPMQVMVEVASGDYHFKRMKPWKAGILKDEFIFERASFPESHASTIVETPEGLVAAWFGGTKEGYKDVCIYTSHLKNGVWSTPVMVADGVLNDSVRHPTYNPVLFYAPTGELLLFYKIGPNVAGWTGWMMRSKDNGHTWSKREALPDGILGPIKNKPELINNVLLCPSSTEKEGWKAHIEFTTDWGKTWTMTGPLNDGKTYSAIQPSILTYADGSMQILCRSMNRTVNEAWSKDGGKTWSPMQASGLPNNNSGTDAVTLKDGTQLIVYNHVKPDSSLPRGKGARTPLNVAISKDGKQWNAALLLEDSPISQYSYPSVIQTSDGLVHIVYTWRRERIKHVVVDPAKLQTKPIVHEQWPGGLVQVHEPSDD